MFANESEAYAESKAYDSASVAPIHTRSKLSSDSDSAYDSASVASVASVNQALCGFPCELISNLLMLSLILRKLLILVLNIYLLLKLNNLSSLLLFLILNKFPS